MSSVTSLTTTLTETLDEEEGVNKKRILDDVNGKPPLNETPPAFNNLTKAITCNIFLGLSSLIIECVAITDDQRWNRISTQSVRFPVVYMEHHFSGKLMRLDMSNSHVSRAMNLLHRHNKVAFAFVGVTLLYITLTFIHLVAYCYKPSIRAKNVHTDALYIIGGVTMLLMTVMLAAKAIFEPSKYKKAAVEITSYMLQLSPHMEIKHHPIKKHGRSAEESGEDEYDDEDRLDRIINLIKKQVEAAESPDNFFGRSSERGRHGLLIDSEGLPAPYVDTPHDDDKRNPDQLTEANYWRSALLTCSQNTFFEGVKGPKGNDSQTFKHGFKLGGTDYTPRVLEKLGFCDEETMRHIALWLCFAYSLVCCLIPCTPWCMVNKPKSPEEITETGEPETTLKLDKIDEKKLKKLLASGNITARRALIQPQSKSKSNNRNPPAVFQRYSMNTLSSISTSVPPSPTTYAGSTAAATSESLYSRVLGQQGKELRTEDGRIIKNPFALKQDRDKGQLHSHVKEVIKKNKNESNHADK